MPENHDPATEPEPAVDEHDGDAPEAADAPDTTGLEHDPGGEPAVAEDEPGGEPAVDEDDEAVAPLTLPTWKLLAGGAAVVLVVAIVIVVAIRVFDDGGDGGGDEAGGDDAPAIVDTFDRADAPDELGATESGQPWESVQGTWGIRDEQAVLVEANPDGVRSVAVVDLGSSDGTVTVTAGTLTQGWGMVFRYQGPFNYWYLTASPEFATYNLNRVVDGEVQNLGAVGLAEVVDGTEVQVKLEGATIEVYVDGTLVKAITDTTLIGATQAGLLASGAQAADASWDAFEASPAAGGGAAAVTPETVPQAESTTTAAPTTAAPTTAAPAPGP